AQASLHASSAAFDPIGACRAAFTPVDDHRKHPTPVRTTTGLPVSSTLSRRHSRNLRQEFAADYRTRCRTRGALLPLQRTGRGWRMTNERIVLSVEGLKKYFQIRKGILRRVVGSVKAVDDISFRISHGETLSLVGESGCGKTTTSRCILRAIRPTAGAIRF